MMLEWIQSNWMIVIGTVVALYAGVTIPGIRGLVFKAFKELVSKNVIEQALLEFATWYVKRTETKVDDKWLEALKKSMGK
jgi:hypothetical protein